MATNPKNLSNEREVYIRENQMDTFKNRLKPVLGKSFKENEFDHLINLKKEEFENAITKKFNELRDRRKKALSESQNSDLEKRVFWSNFVPNSARVGPNWPKL